MIYKGLYEERLTLDDLDLPPLLAERYLREKGFRSLRLNLLGSWAMIVETKQLIDLELLPYPNRSNKARLKVWLSEKIK